MAGMKCTGCGAVKDTAEFSANNRNKNGLRAQCKACCSADAKAYKATDRGKAAWKVYAATPERREKARVHARGRSKAARRAERERAAAKQGRTLPPQGRKRLHPVGFNEICLDDLAERNARQAWKYWLKVKAPLVWLREYHKQPGAVKTTRLRESEVYRIRYRYNPEFQIAERIRRQINKKKKSDGIGDVMRAGLKSGGRSRAVERSLGYSIAELKIHIERQFTKGMSWTLFLDGQIHIDHIIPQALYDLSDDEDWQACWALSNLMPLWDKDNRAKRDKVLSLL